MGATVTVATVFTDLVDSTAVASRLGPDATEALRREHYAVLRAAIAAAGGTEIKSTGDGVMVVFPSASAAVDCAVAMQQGLERFNRDAPEPLRVRIGVSVGEAERADDDYYGQSVVEAARLCAAAEGGQILAAEVVQTLGGARGGHEFRPVGALELKGLAAPLPTREVAWAPATAAALPFPARLRGWSGGEFFGRRAEAEVLDQAEKEAAAGTRRAVFVAGEAGIGKTRLMAEAARTAHDGGATVLYGRCDEDLGAPYQPFAEALGAYVELGSSAVVDAHVERRGGALARVVPELARRVAVPPLESVNPDAERYELFSAVVDLLARAAEETPVLLILDDLHWADTPSLRLLRHVLASSDETRLLVLAAYREADLGRDHPLVDLLAALHRERGVERLVLGGLDDVDLMALLETRSGRPLDEQGVGLAQALRRETSGNPFFVDEVLRHLAETGSIARQADGTWIGARELADFGLPQSVREVVGRRVARLGEQPLRVLSVAAVIGRQFDVDLLGRVAELGEDELLDVLDTARQAALVEDVPDAPEQLTFTHGLIEHTLYEDLSGPRRQRAHRRVAEALEELGGDEEARVAELAYHWGQATAPADAPKAIAYARRAGTQAVAQLAPDDAVRWFHQALTLVEHLTPADEGLRCDVLIELGEAQRRAGEGTHERTLQEASDLARRLGSADRLVRAVLGGEHWATPSAAWVPAVRPRIEEALAVVPPGDSASRSRLLAYLIVASEGFEHRSALADEAIAVARHVGDARVLCNALLLACQGLAPPTTLKARQAWASEALDLSTSSGDLYGQFGAYYALDWAHLEQGDFAAADAANEQMDRLNDRLCMPDTDLAMMTNRSWRALAAGRLEEAERHMSEGRARAERIGYPGGRIMAGAIELALRRYQGRVEEVVDFLNEVADATPGANRLNLDIARAFMYCELGDYPRVRELFAEVWALDALPFDQSWLSTLHMLAVMACVLDERGAADELYGHLEPWAERVVVFGNGAGSVHQYLGVLATTLARYDRAEEHLQAALATHQRLGAPYWTGQTQLALAQLARTRPHPDVAAAAALAAATRDLAARHGYRTLERRAQTLLNATT